MMQLASLSNSPQKRLYQITCFDAGYTELNEPPRIHWSQTDDFGSTRFARFEIARDKEIPLHKGRCL